MCCSIYRTMHRFIVGYSSAARNHDQLYGVEHSERSLKSLNCSQAIFTATIRPVPARFLLLIWVLDTLSIPSSSLGESSGQA